MTIGEKIKTLREQKGLTQKQLASSFITRNMLSRIENGFAQPSLTTLEHIANALEIDAGYFVSSIDDPAIFRKLKFLDRIKRFNSEKDHSACLEYASVFQNRDPELSLYFYSSSMALANEHFASGEFELALSYYEKSADFAKALPLDMPFIDISLHYVSLCKKISEGKLGEPSFPSEKGILLSLHEDFLYEFLLKLIKSGKTEAAAQVFDLIKISNPLYRTHINARLSMASSNHERAKTLLFEMLEALKRNDNIALLYTVYSDLEKCCKALSDYEGAYNSALSKNTLARNYDLKAFDEG